MKKNTKNVCGLRHQKEVFDSDPTIYIFLQDSESDEEYIEDRQIIVGICAMAKKSNSKPMREILTRLQRYNTFKHLKPIELNHKGSRELLHLNQEI